MTRHSVFAHINRHIISLIQKFCRPFYSIRSNIPTHLCFSCVEFRYNRSPVIIGSNRYTEVQIKAYKVNRSTDILYIFLIISWKNIVIFNFSFNRIISLYNRVKPPIYLMYPHIWFFTVNLKHFCSRRIYINNILFIEWVEIVHIRRYTNQYIFSSVFF